MKQKTKQPQPIPEPASSSKHAEKDFLEEAGVEPLDDVVDLLDGLDGLY